MSVRRTGALLALLAALPGCTTWTMIESEPPGAEIRVDGELLGTAPATVPLRFHSAWRRHTLELSLPGHETRRVVLPKRTYWGHVAGDVIGIVTIPLTLVNARGPGTYYRYPLARER